MVTTILDCYTDEPSGLGVPPYLGTYPRYLAAELENPNYITIDDLRLHIFYKDKIKPTREKDKTNIKIYNLTKNYTKIKQILDKTEELIIILGVHVPGKYLSALPGTLKEITQLTKDLNCKLTLTGPAIHGTQLQGGRFSEKIDTKRFKIKEYNIELNKIKANPSILKQIPDHRIIEIETSRGCPIGKCSFCLEPIKCKFTNRKTTNIIEEINEYYKAGARYFRLGKQSDFYSINTPIKLLETINKKFPKIKVLHIDNVNPNSVITKNGIEITKAIVKYTTPGNIASLGIESFDPEVIKANSLNCKPETAFKAIKIINKYGNKRGKNGMHEFLPGINLILGLNKESKSTHKHNLEALQKITKNNLLRRINIRQATILEGTKLEKLCGNKFLRKNNKFYWKWRNEIRQKIDFPMLKRILPKETIIKDVKAEIYDGKTTFCRQLGTYPLIVGVKQRLELKKFYNIKIVDHMLRSVVGEVV